MNIVQNLIIHHSITPRDLEIAKTETSINRNHKDRGFPKSSLGFYVGYHYMIFGSGELRQYRQENEQGAHTKEQGMNFKSLGICLIGDFDKEEPSKEQIETLTQLLTAKIKTYNIPLINIYPHRKFATYKSCYGLKLTDDWARSLISMQQFKTQNYKGELRVVLQADSMETWKALCRVYGLDPNKIDEEINA